jgi:hypothetical protein
LTGNNVGLRTSYIGKYSITGWNLLPEGAIWTFHGKMHIFKTSVRKMKTSEGK